MLFIAGLPRTNEEFVRLCEDRNKGAGFKQRFAEFVNSVVNCSLLVGLTEGHVPQCPNCNEEALLPLEQIPPYAYRSLRRCVKPPCTSICRVCQSRFGGTEVLRSEVQNLYGELLRYEFAHSSLQIPVLKDAKESDMLTEAYCSIPAKGEWPPDDKDPDCPSNIAHRLRVSQIGLLVQQHNYHHVPSCFKSSLSSKSGECRYRFPKHSALCTKVEGNTLKLRRAVHNEYINNYSPLMLRLFCSNHDIRFLTGDGTTDALYYVLKYATKPQNQVDSLEAILLLSFDKRIETESHLKSNGSQLHLSSWPKQELIQWQWHQPKSRKYLLLWLCSISITRQHLYHHTNSLPFSLRSSCP